MDRPTPVDTIATLTAVEKKRLELYAARASWFRGSLPTSLQDSADFITATFMPAYTMEMEQNRRLGATRLKIGRFREEPRVGGNPMATQIHSGKAARAPLTGADIDGAPADVSGATVTSADTTQVTARLEPNGRGGTDLVVTDVPNSNLGPVDVTVTLRDLPPLVETIEVIAADAVALNLGSFTEEDRESGEPTPTPDPEPTPE